MNADFHINGIQLETERLILRPFVKEDLDDFHAYASVEGAVKWLVGNIIPVKKKRKKY